jgi:streptomycin 6-kinase
MSPGLAFPIPDGLARINRETFGEAGERWLAALPALLEEYATRWNLILGPPFVPLSYNYVAPATRRADGSRAVLKIGVAEGTVQNERIAEIEALRLFDGRGIVRLLDADPERGAMLLERLTPGAMLTEVAARDVEEATRIAARVMKRLRRPAPPAPYPFPSVADWAAGLNCLRGHFGGTTGPFPAALVDEAQALFADLLAATDSPMLLHGDLHHFNILSAASTETRDARLSWLAIDPKGILGDPGYEVGALLYNPDPHMLALPQLVPLLARRVAVLAEELDMDRARIRGWGVAQAVLSAWWGAKDNATGGWWEAVLAIAERLSALKV